MLTSGQDTAELFFEDLRVPNSALLGKENHGFYYLMDQLPQERVGPDSNLLWQLLGGMRRGGDRQGGGHVWVDQGLGEAEEGLWEESGRPADGESLLKF